MYHNSILDRPWSQKDAKPKVSVKAKAAASDDDDVEVVDKKSSSSRPSTSKKAAKEEQEVKLVGPIGWLKNKAQHDRDAFRQKVDDDIHKFEDKAEDRRHRAAAAVDKILPF